MVCRKNKSKINVSPIALLKLIKVLYGKNYPERLFFRICIKQIKPERC